MSKAVMLSIRPKWCEKIVSGEKTIEVRKTRPKLDMPFRGYIYCTLCVMNLGVHHAKMAVISSARRRVGAMWRR